MKHIETLHLYNVRLLETPSTQLFHVIIKDGRYESIEKQFESPVLQGSALSQITVNQLDEQKIINVEGRYLLPSFIDIHTHLDKAYSLASVPNKSGTLQEAIKNYSERASQFSPSEIKERVKRAALQSLSHGTTNIRTHVNFEMDISEEIALHHLQAVLEVKNELRNVMSIQVVPMFSYLSSRSKRQLEVVEEAISYGVDGIGGAPHLSPNAEDDIDLLFQFAYKHNKFLDLHVDEQDDPAVCTIEHIIEKTIQYDFQGKVVTGHLCSLAAMDERKAQTIMEKMNKVKIGAVTLPGANMYLQGRNDKGLIRRGITRVRELIEHGVSVATASDNVNDPFHPFGRCDMLQIGLLTAYTTHLASERELHHVVKMITEIPAGFYGLENHAVKEEAKANFVIVDGEDLYDLFAALSPSRYVFHKGQWISVTKSDTQQLIPSKISKIEKMG